MLEVFIRYERYVAILKWTSFVLLAYVAVALVVDVPWGMVLYRTFVPNFSLETDYIVTVVAVLGTTITPYCFFWQSSQEAEDERTGSRSAYACLSTPAGGAGPDQPDALRYLCRDGLLERHQPVHHRQHRGDVERARHHRHPDLRPGGRGAAADRRRVHVRPVRRGIIGIGLLAVPVLAGSGAYALGEALGWTTGLDRKPRDAKAFYGTIAVSTLIGVRHQFHRARPDQGAVLVGGDQWRGGGAADGHHHADGDAPRRDGSVCTASRVVGHGVAVHGGNGGRGGADVRDLAVLTRLWARALCLVDATPRLDQIPGEWRATSSVALSVLPPSSSHAGRRRSRLDRRLGVSRVIPPMSTKRGCGAGHEGADDQGQDHQK